MSGRYVVATTNSLAMAKHLEAAALEDFPDSTRTEARADGLIVISVDAEEFERWVETP